MAWPFSEPDFRGRIYNLASYRNAFSQLQSAHYLKWLNRGPNAYLWAAFTGIFPSRHSLSQIVNHSIVLIYLPKLPTYCIYVFRSIVTADSQHCAV